MWWCRVGARKGRPKAPSVSSPIATASETPSTLLRAGWQAYLYTGNCWESGQLRGVPRVPIAVVGVCSSRAFLIHKWMVIHAFIKVIEPGSDCREVYWYVHRR
jgi:hypothetical protein